MVIDNPLSKKGPGRPRTRLVPDLRVTVRFRHHLDPDLICALQAVPNKNEWIRAALRDWLRRYAECGYEGSPLGSPAGGER